LRIEEIKAFMYPKDKKVYRDKKEIPMLEFGVEVVTIMAII